MIHLFHPSFSGIYQPDTLAPDVLDRLATRLRSHGLLAVRSRRNVYQIEAQTPVSLHFKSANLLTAINIGLNDVLLLIDSDTGTIHYQVSYWIWARYSLGLGIALFCLLAFCLASPLWGWTFFVLKNYSSPQDLVATVLPLAGFWCLVWPWVLIWMHKGPAKGCLHRILAEVNTRSSLGCTRSRSD